MNVTVSYNRLPIAPRKLRAVLPSLRHRRVMDVIAIMAAMPRQTTTPIEKLLKASISAAKDRNPAIRPELLVIDEIYCNEATRLYRTRRKSRGRASRIAKRGSHLTLTVSWTEAPAAAAPKKTASKVASAKTKASTDTTGTDKPSATDKPKQSAVRKA